MVIRLTLFLCERRDKSAALSFFRKAITENKVPQKVVIDKSGSNKAALDAINKELDQDHKIQIFQSKYLNNIVEQDHQKGQIIGAKNHLSTFENFAMIMAA